MAAIVALCLLAACGSAITLPEPAEGPPTENPPHPIADTLKVEADKVVDSQAVTGQCVHLYLWSQDGIEADWLAVAQNTTLVTPDFRDSEGAPVFCELGGHLGPRSYDLPTSKVPDGWYVVCNLSNECTAPFEKA